METHDENSFPQSSAGALYGRLKDEQVLFNAGVAAPAPRVARPLAGPAREAPGHNAEAFAAKGVALSESRPLDAAWGQPANGLAVPSTFVTLPLEIAALQERLEGRADMRLPDVILWACARALRQFPEFNAYRQGNELRVYGEVNLCIACERDGRRAVWALRGVEALPLPGIAAARREMGRAFSADAEPRAAMDNATFTVTDFFDAGIVHMQEPVRAGQSAALVIGAPWRQPVSDSAGVRFASHINLMLAYDTAVADAARAAAFLKMVARHSAEAALSGESEPKSLPD